jgi:hypothetical protein
MAPNELSKYVRRSPLAPHAVIFISHPQLFSLNTIFGDITTNPYHLETILRSDLTKALTGLVPEILDEAQQAISEVFQQKSTSEGLVTVTAFETIVRIVARVVNRAMIGTPGCRHERFLMKQMALAENFIGVSQLLTWFPEWMKPYVSLI